MNEHIPKEWQDELNKKNEAYILITCDSESQNGEMNVQMSYEGDPVLVSYLLQGAQEIVDQEEPCELITKDG